MATRSPHVEEVRALRSSRDRVSKLLTRYPDVSEEHRREILEFFKEGRHIDIGLLTAPEARVLETADRVGNRPWALKQIAQLKKRRTLRRLGQLSELALPAVILLFGSYVLFQALGVFEFLTDVVYSQL